MARQTRERTRYPGIYKIHKRGCQWEADRALCRCPASYQSAVYSSRERKTITKHFAVLGEARTWREDAAGAVRSGKLRSPTATTVEQAGERLIAGMRDGSILTRSGKPYKPSVARTYERSLRRFINPALGNRRLSRLERRDVQAFVDELRANTTLMPSTIQNTVNPLQVICRRARRDGEIVIDPTDGLELPVIRGRRDNIASPAQAAALIAAAPDQDRGFWATAFYSGARRGELRAMRVRDVLFDEGVIHVQRNWDDVEGEVDVKTDAGNRRIPLVGELRRILAAHILATGRSGDDLLFGRTAELPFTATTMRDRAMRAWGKENQRLREEADDPDSVELLVPLTPHDARHCAASYLIAAGLNPKKLSVYIGHSDIRTTYNRYGHLMPGGETEDAEQLDGWFQESLRRTAELSAAREADAAAPPPVSLVERAR